MSKCKIKGKVLVIRLGREQTQMALVDGNSQILNTMLLQTPKGAVDDGVIRDSVAIRDMLKNALRNREFKNIRQVVFSMCTSLVIVETTTTPDLPDAKLEKLLQANSDMYFPVDMQDYHMVWQVVGPAKKENGAKELDVQLWAVPNSMLTAYYELANSCGLSVTAVDYCGHSIAEAIGASFAHNNKAPKEKKERKKLDLNKEITFGRKNKQSEVTETTAEDGKRANPKTDMHLTLENEFIGMTFVQNGRVVFQRSIRCGYDAYQQFGEVAMMVEYFRSMDIGRGSEIKGFVSGALSNDEQLVAELADTLYMSLSKLFVPYDPAWMICVGASHTKLDFGNIELNRVKKARKKGNSRIWQYIILLLAAMCFVAMVLYVLSERLAWNSEISSLDSDVAVLSAQAQKTADYADNYNTYSAMYDSYSNDWDTIFASLQTYNDNLALVLEELEDTLPEKTSVTNIQITPEGLNVEFACEKKEEAAYLIMALREFKYADLLGITDLRGGGRGPATSYGSGEAPPTEGSGYESELANYLVQADVVNTLYGLASSSNSNDFKDFKSSDYYSPAPSASLTGDRAESVIKAKVKDMLCNNPVAGEIFGKILEKEMSMSSNESILLHMIMLDAINLNASNAFKGKTRQQQMEIFVDELLYKDSTPDSTGKVYTVSEKLTAVEKLICTDDELENWYVYYVNGGSEKLPYLNTENMEQDLKDTDKLTTGNSTVDQKLNALITDEARTYIESLESESETPGGDEPGGDESGGDEPGGDEPGGDEPGGDEPGGDEPGDDDPTFTQKDIEKYLDSYLTNGSTGNMLADTLIYSYLTTGTTGNTTVDGMIESYMDSSAMDSKVSALVNKYLRTGTTGNTVIDDLLDKYFKTGSTGNRKLDARIDKYIDAGFVNDELSDLVLDYIVDGKTNNPVFDEMLKKYATTGTTGNTKIDALIDKYVSDDFKDNNDQTSGVNIEKMINDYINYGTTGNTLADAMVRKYLDTGTTGNTELDKRLNAYIDGGNMNSQIKLLVNKFISNGGSTGSKVVDELLKKYYANGSTGNKKIDKLIANALLVNGGTSEGDINDLLDKLLGEDSENGDGTDPNDTRIFFTVALGYNETLRDEELNRKGLSEENKVDKVEVAE